MNYAIVRSNRIDTIITRVSIRQGEGRNDRAAVAYIKKRFPDAVIIGVWPVHKPDGRRLMDGNGINPIYEVEWCSDD